MPTTTRGYRYPAGSAAPNVPTDLANLAADIDADMALSAPGSWTAFTPSWEGQGGDPVLGNGTMISRYQKLGRKTVMYVGQITMGSTTTYGSGLWSVSLPVSARPVVPLMLSPGTAYFWDNSTVGNRTPGVAMLFGGGDISFATPGVTAVGATAPFTWAVNDYFLWSFIYETA